MSSPKKSDNLWLYQNVALQKLITNSNKVKDLTDLCSQNTFINLTWQENGTKKNTNPTAAKSGSQPSVWGGGTIVCSHYFPKMRPGPQKKAPKKAFSRLWCSWRPCAPEAAFLLNWAVHRCPFGPQRAPSFWSIQRCKMMRSVGGDMIINGIMFWKRRWHL